MVLQEVRSKEEIKVPKKTIYDKSISKNGQYDVHS